MLPFNSTATLVDLSLEFVETGYTLKHIESLDEFICLKKLSIDHLKLDICNFLLRSSLRLESFVAFADSDLVGVETLATTLSATVVRNIKELSFVLCDTAADTPIPTLRSLITAITNLPLLKELHLEYPLEIGWCEDFRYVSTLRRLRWRVTNLWYKSTKPPNTNDVKHALLTALHKIDPLPTVYVRVPEPSEDNGDTDPEDGEDSADSDTGEYDDSITEDSDSSANSDIEDASLSTG